MTRPEVETLNVSEDAELAGILEAYLADLEAGRQPDPERLLAEHPHLADRLRSCLASLDVVGRVGRTLTAESQAQALPRLADYEILRELGRGGMGVVYEARQQGLNRIVALKVILSGEFASESDIRRFRAEAESVGGLDHPNIVPVYEVGEDRNRHYFSMKRIDGGSLADHRDSVREDPRGVARLVATIARAVDHAHQRGILHRDLKPSNILLDADGRPHVTDFGLAKRVDKGGDRDATRTGAVLGSPPYMAPEQVASDKQAVTTATDVYGLGAILYSLLTGRPPFQGDSVVETIERVKAGNPDPPSGINRAIDPDLEAICLKSLERDPRRRYRSAAELAEDLDRWLAGAPTLARPLSRLARWRRWAWRRRWRLAAVSGVLLVLGLAALGAWQADRLRRTRQLAQRQVEAIHRRDGEIRRARYISDIHTVAALIAVNKMAIDHLNDLLPAAGAEDLRGFEWYYLRRMSRADRASWVGHEGHEMYHVEFAPDGRTLATAGGDGTARIWDAETGQQRLVLRGHTADVNWVSFDSAGKRLVTAGDDGKVRVWDGSDGRVLSDLDGGSGEMVAALFTPDGHDVIGATRDGLLVRWDLATRQRRAEKRHWDGQRRVESLAISSDGTHLALGTYGGIVVLHDLSDGGFTKFVGLRLGGAYGMAFAPDGRTLAVTGWEYVSALLYDVFSGRQQTIPEGFTDEPYSLAFSPDGRTLAVGGGSGALRLWDLGSKSCRTTLLGHSDRIWGVAFAPNGRTLATTSRDGTIRLWDATGHPGQAVFRGLKRQDAGGKPAAAVAFAEGGTRVLAANVAGDVLECDVTTAATRVLRTSETLLSNGFAFLAPDCATLAVSGQTEPGNAASHTAILYDLHGDQKPVALEQQHSSNALSWAPDGKRLAVVDQGNLYLFDSTGQLLGRTDFGSGRAWSCPAFLPAGDVLVECRESYTNARPFEFVTWDTARSRVDRFPIAEGQPRPTSKIAVSPNGRTLASLGDLWDLTPLHHRCGLVGHKDRITDLAIAPDSRTIATSSLDKTVKLWNVATGQELLTLDGHTGTVRAVAFSPDGRALASCGDGPGGAIEVIVWRAESRSRTDPLEGQPRSP
jgi:WD40 repeat protein/predicted Ser/Thr protein kinase